MDVSETERTKRRGRLVALGLVGALFLAQVAVVVWVILGERAARRANAELQVSLGRAPGPSWWPNGTEPIVRPRTVAAAESGLKPDETVIGVEVNGRARAYRLAAMRDRGGHLINDVIGGVPVSVAYCNLTDCVRVYTGSAGSGPLDVKVSGLYNTEMVIEVNGVRYFHDSGQPLDPEQADTPFPYPTLPPERLTWGDWVGRRPDTDVYFGDRRSHLGGAPESAGGL